MNQTAVSLRGLIRSFGGRTALNGLDLDVGKAEIFGILGPDGAGKSTLMRILAGILSRHGGDVSVLGLDPATEADSLSDRIAYMPQRFGLYEDLSVGENIEFYADLYDVPRGAERRERVDRLLAFCRLTPFVDRRAGKLSGGMKQKLALCSALVHTPELLLLDEPTNGVDPVSRRDFWSILQDMPSQGVTVIVATTYLDEAERCSRVALLDEGRLTGVDTPAALRAGLTRTMWRIESEDPFSAAAVLESLPGVESVHCMGGAVHCFIDGHDGTLKPEIIQRALQEAGIPSSAPQPAQPSLEDVFVERTGGSHDG